MPKISVVIPVFNEEKVLPLLRQRLESVLGKIHENYEIIVVNDGSTDNSSNLIEEWIRQDSRVILIELSRNFGHQPAIMSGLREASGDAVVIMDADLQDPPEVIPQMLEKWHQGAKIVLAERRARDENFIRKVLFDLFYKIFAVISDLNVKVSSGVFGLMDRVAVDEILKLEERNRYLPGLRGWIGFQTASIFYHREDRPVDKPKQSLRRLFAYAFNALFSFSYKPLRLSLILGCLISLSCFIYACILVIKRLYNIDVVSGFTTPTVAILFLGGLILISNGILGEYLGRVYEEVKKRPIYIVSRKVKKK